MDQMSKALKEKLDLFLKESLRSIKKTKTHHAELSHQEIDALSQRINELHHCARDLLSTRPSESIYYNAKIIKEMIEQRFGKDGNSLLKAANTTNEQIKQETLKSLIQVLAEKDAEREVFFDNLKDISNELAA